MDFPVVHHFAQRCRLLHILVFQRHREIKQRFFTLDIVSIWITLLKPSHQSVVFQQLIDLFNNMWGISLNVLQCGVHTHFTRSVRGVAKRSASLLNFHSRIILHLLGQSFQMQ
ncbi:hypothetical protein DN31_3707 [Vibrio mimicus]|nr:hypothetical protein DN31_3707 [Vibrio mimicus]